MEAKKRRAEDKAEGNPTIYNVVFQNIWNNRQHYGSSSDDGEGGKVKSTHRSRRNALIAAIRINMKLWQDIFNDWKYEFEANYFPDESVMEHYDKELCKKLQDEAPRLYELVHRVIDARGEGAGDFDAFMALNPSDSELELMQEYLVKFSGIREDESNGILMCERYEYCVIQESVLED